MKAVDDAEKKFGRPVYAYEIYQALCQQHKYHQKQGNLKESQQIDTLAIMEALVHTVKNDEILIDETFTKFTLKSQNQKKPTNMADFHLCSDIMTTKFNHQLYENAGKLFPFEGKNTVMNLNILRKIFT